jgi:hypothetical protein
MVGGSARLPRCVAEALLCPQEILASTGVYRRILFLRMPQPGAGDLRLRRPAGGTSTRRPQEELGANRGGLRGRYPKRRDAESASVVGGSSSVEKGCLARQSARWQAAGASRCQTSSRLGAPTEGPDRRSGRGAHVISLSANDPESGRTRNTCRPRKVRHSPRTSTNTGSTAPVGTPAAGVQVPSPTRKNSTCRPARVGTQVVERGARYSNHALPREGSRAPE